MTVCIVPSLGCPPAHPTNTQGCPDQLRLEANELALPDGLSWRGWKQAHRKRPRLPSHCLQAPVTQSTESHRRPGTLPHTVPSARPAATKLRLHPGWRTGKQQALGGTAAAPSPRTPRRVQAARPPPDPAPASGSSPRRNGKRTTARQALRRETARFPLLPAQLCRSHAR